METIKQIILASASPRRKELLEQIGLEFEIIPAKGEEVITKIAPHEVVMELSRQKALEVAGMVRQFAKENEEIAEPQDTLVIGADTVVAAFNEEENMEILGKPKDEADAYRMLSMLSGKVHSVYTGVTFAFLDKSGRSGVHSFYEKTDVYMKKLSDLEIKRYIATGEPSDKAGGYGIQGKCAIYIEKIDGDYNNVVGLPIAGIYSELQKLGIDIYANSSAIDKKICESCLHE